MIKDFRILKEEHLCSKVRISFQFKLEKHDNLLYSFYDYSEEEINIFEWYNQTSWESKDVDFFSEEEKEKLIEIILGLKRHRLRHLIKPYRFNT